MSIGVRVPSSSRTATLDVPERNLWAQFQSTLNAYDILPEDYQVERELEQFFSSQIQRNFDQQMLALGPEEAEAKGAEAAAGIAVIAAALRTLVAEKEGVSDSRTILRFGLIDFHKILGILCPVWPIC